MSDLPNTPLNEIPLNLGDYVIPEQAPECGDHLRDAGMRMLISAAKRKAQTEYAYQLVLMHREEGTPPADILQAVLNTHDDKLIGIYTRTVNKLLYPKKSAWTYERRLALHVIGALAVDSLDLPERWFTNSDSPSELHFNIDAVADALIDGMHRLGCPDHLKLNQILDLASTHSEQYKSASKDGAE